MNFVSWLRFYRYNPYALGIALRYRKKQRSNSDLLGVAVLGCGGGGLMHISHYLWHGETDVRAVYDIDEHRFADLDKRFPYMRKDVLRTTNLREAIERDDVDIVSIATPDHTHADYAVAALEAGKHVLCEKPMCTTLEDSARIIRAVDQANTVFAVFQQMRFVPRNMSIKKLIDQGELGEIFYIETGYIHDMRHRANEFSDWRLNPETFQHPIFGASHHIDLLHWMVGEVVEVQTIGSHKGLPVYPADDTYVTALRLANGGVGHVLTCFGPRVPKEFHPVRIYGTKGSVHDSIVFLEGRGKISSLTLKGSSYRGVPQFRAQISHFVDCVRGRANPMVTA
ncbi:MAG: gfo/Idh/MocA family oxidoreductase, partial [Planctomycetaceae bacterium]